MASITNPVASVRRTSTSKAKLPSCQWPRNCTDGALSRKAVALLKELPRWMDGSVFPINAPAHHKAFKGHANGPDWSIFHWHDLRHTAITRLATKLPNLIERAAVSRHRSLTMLKRYYHPSAAELAEKMLSGPAVRKGIGDSMSFLIDLICTAKKNPPKRVGGSERSKGD